MNRFLPRLALTTVLLAGALAGNPTFAFAGNLPTTIDGNVTVMHANDIHGSYKSSTSGPITPAASFLLAALT